MCKIFNYYILCTYTLFDINVVFLYIIYIHAITTTTNNNNNAKTTGDTLYIHLK